MFDSRYSRWRKLDNAAQIFPATRDNKDTRVFRFYCLLKEEINPNVLQQALEITMKQYPVFQSVMRRGLFWYYLERTQEQPNVILERKAPCSHIYIPDRKSLLFEVSYYKNRINFEVFHVLTDGTGATQFLRELVKQYLLLAHSEADLPDIPLKDEMLTAKDQEDDGFSRYYSDTPKLPKRKPIAHQLSRRGVDVYELQLGEATLSVKEVLAKSRELGVSITVFLTSVLLCSIGQDMSVWQRKRPVTLMVPVNLRNFFPSESMLNFFGWIEVGYLFGDEELNFEKVLAHVQQFFQQELTKERVAMRMNEYIRLEKHPILRFAPLELKNIGIQAGRRQSNRELTAVFSNMSVVKMPPEYARYIERFGVFTSTDKTELCACSFQDVLSLGFTSRQVSLNVQRNFWRMLEEMGISVHLSKTEEEYPLRESKASVGLQFLQWLTFLCIAITVVCGVLNITLMPRRLWFFYVAGGALSMWVMGGIGFYKRRNLLKNSMWQLILGSAAVVLWDLIIGWKGWSVNYVIPSMIMLVELLMLALSKILKMEAREYMIYYMMAAVYGLFPGILLLTGVSKSIYLSLICTGISFLFLVALVIFRRRELSQELHKNFHI